MHKSSIVEDGYGLWLRHPELSASTKAVVERELTPVALSESSPIRSAIRDELTLGFKGLLGKDLRVGQGGAMSSGLVILCQSELSNWGLSVLEADLAGLGAEGFLLRQVDRPSGRIWVLAANADRGLLYGGFALLRHLAAGGNLEDLACTSRPRMALRLLNHWDNLNGTIERGYAGFSLWDWHKLPDYVSPRYRDYARANASIGINGVVLNNVNASPLVLTAEYLPKIAALAAAFRPYGIQVFLSARFSAPIELGGLKTADPLDAAVGAFWREKIAEIYRWVPDFGGFLVKANSEGQPGPEDYGRSHAEGANLLADALAPFGGWVIWRAFVYRASAKLQDDRAKQAVREFSPLDGKFKPNVLLQVKNGPIDFQPREPFSPLFGGMPKTPMVLEVQLTQEYLGFATHLAYLGTMWKETLDADTYQRGMGSTVAKVVDGSLYGHAVSGMAGVTNIGSDRNWCGHPFAQANWYAFGRLAWDPDLSAETIAQEWLHQTFSTESAFVEPALRMMMESRETVVNYMTPLGLHHLMGKDHHYGPGPWVSEGRPDWTSPYYHRADAAGLGFDRTATGSGAVLQYQSPLREIWGDVRSCPLSLLLWFHHVAWDQVLSSGRTLWNELCHRYTGGAQTVGKMRETWAGLAKYIDRSRHDHVAALLAIQEKEAWWWRHACLLYFQTFSKRPMPEGLPPLVGTLAEYQAKVFHHVPGI